MSHEIKLRKGFSDDEDVVAEVLSEGEVIHLALKDGDGLYSVPVNYGYNNGTIYIHSSKVGRKISALASGEEIGFSVIASYAIEPNDKPCKWGCSFRSVVGTGVPRFLEDQEKVGALNIVMEHFNSKQCDIDPVSVKAIEVVEIMITSATVRIVGKN